MVAEDINKYQIIDHHALIDPNSVAVLPNMKTNKSAAIKELARSITVKPDVIIIEGENVIQSVGSTKKNK